MKWKKKLAKAEKKTVRGIQSGIRGVGKSIQRGLGRPRGLRSVTETQMYKGKVYPKRFKIR